MQMTVNFTEFVPPHFYKLTNAFMNDKYSHYWLAGGRGSVKSSIASELIVIGIMSNPTVSYTHLTLPTRTVV